MRDETHATEIVDGSRTVDLLRREVRLTAADGAPLVATVKRPLDTGRGKPPVLLVHGLGQNRYSWHLSRRSFENHLVAHGFETWNLELRGHGLSGEAGSPHPATVEEYVERDVPAAIDAMLRESGHDRGQYIGHSLGAMIGMLLAPATLDRLAGLVSIGGPVHFGRGNWRLRAGAALGGRALDYSLVRVWPRLPFLVGMFGRSFARQAWNTDSRFSLFPLHIWYPGTIERDLLRERITDGWDRTGLGVLRQMLGWARTDTFASADGRTDYLPRLRQLRVPLLCVVGEEDDPVPPASVAEGFDLVGSADKTWLQFGTSSHGTPFGHLDLICGRRAPEHVWPAISHWLDERVPR